MQLAKERFSYGLIFFFSLDWGLIILSKQNIVPFVYQTGSITHDLMLRRQVSQARIAVTAIVSAAIMCCGYKKIINSITQHPIFLLLLAFFGNYCIDLASYYQRIDSVLDFFSFSQQMNCYMLCLVAIKNAMPPSKSIEQDFLARIQNNAGYTLQELEQFVFIVLHSSIEAVNNLCMDVGTIDIEEKIYELLKEQVTIDQMLLVCQQDEPLRDQLEVFSQNPEKEYAITVDMICLLIKGRLNLFMQKNIHIV